MMELGGARGGGDGMGGDGVNPIAPPFPRVPMAVQQQLDRTLGGLDFAIDRTWNGMPVDHEAYTFHLEWFFQRIPGKPHKRVVKGFFDGPLFDDPEQPDHFPGICPNLWDYEVVELFFANDRGQYLEVEIGPHGHWLVYLLNGTRKPFNKGEDLELKIQNTFEGNTWRCCFEIPLAYFPPKVTKFNAFAIHGTDPNRQYEALSPVTDGTHEEPDFHRLEFFKRFNSNRIIPEGFNEGLFKDALYGDLWDSEEISKGLAKYNS